MKFLILLLTLHFITCYKIKSREDQYLEILENFILQDRKYILPNDELVSKVNTDLIIRISTPTENLDGIYSYHPPFYSIFNTEDSQNFLIVKFDYKVETYRISSIVLNFKKLFVNNRDSGTSSSENYSETDYEIIILCKKSGGDMGYDNDDTLYITIPIEEVSDPEKFRVYDYLLEGMLGKSNSLKIDKKSKNKFDINHLLSSISNNLLFFRNSKNSDDIFSTEISIKNFFIFQDSLKISNQFKNKIKEFFIKEKVNFQRNELKIRKGFVDFLSESDSEYKNKIQNTHNAMFKSNISLDPDKLVKNFYIRQINTVRQEIYKFDLESFKKYIYEKYHNKLNIYQKLLITEYINVYGRDAGLNQSEIKNEFESMYNKYINLKKNEKEILSNDSVQNENPFTNNANLHKVVKYKPIFTMKNITSVIGKTKNPYIMITDTIHNEDYEKKMLNHNLKNNTDVYDKISKNLIKENKTKNETVKVNINNKTIFKFPEIKIKNNSTQKNVTFSNSSINSNINANIKITKSSINQKNNFTQNNSSQKLQVKNLTLTINTTQPIQNIPVISKNLTSSDQLLNSINTFDKSEPEDQQDIGVSLLNSKKDQIYVQKISNSENKNNSTNVDLDNSNKNKFRRNSPVLKNEKIKYVNGSLVVIQTLMVPNKDEKIADVKRKFLNILKNGLK
jgi:hypothetical protein